MICYRDMTFCNRGKGCTCDPRRKLTAAVKRAAKKAGLPISYGDMCGDKDPIFLPLKELAEGPCKPTP